MRAEFKSKSQKGKVNGMFAKILSTRYVGCRVVAAVRLKFERNRAAAKTGMPQVVARRGCRALSSSRARCRQNWMLTRLRAIVLRSAQRVAALPARAGRRSRIRAGNAN